MQKQELNPEMIELLGAEFQKRYEPNFAMAEAFSVHYQMAALRAYWPLAAQVWTGAAVNIVAPGNNFFNLTVSGTPLWGYTGLAPWIYFTGADYAYYADNAQWDIIGNEAYVAYPGLTLGAWVKFHALGTIMAVITKLNGGGQYAYALRKTAANLMEFGVSLNGAAWTNVLSTTTVAADTWYHVAGKFTPGARIGVYINGIEDNYLAAAIPATIFNSNAQLEIARENSGGGTNYLEGWLSQVFICASRLGDQHIFNAYQQTRAMFGV